MQTSELTEAAAQYILRFPPGHDAAPTFEAYLAERELSSRGLGLVAKTFGAEALRLPALYAGKAPSKARLAALEWHDALASERKDAGMCAFGDKRGVSYTGMLNYVRVNGELQGRWSDSILQAFRVLQGTSHRQQPSQHTAGQSSHSNPSPLEYPGHADDEFYIDELYREFCCPPLSDQAHEDSAFYRRNRELINELCLESDRPFNDEERDKLAASLVVAARGNGMERIDQLAFGDGADAASVWGIQRSSCAHEDALDCKVSSTNVLEKSMEQIGASWPQAMEQFKQHEASRLERQFPLSQQNAVGMEPAMKRFRPS